jgi:mannose-6-phosphate isomerase-like protein (cupin superfamily)
MKFPTVGRRTAACVLGVAALALAAAGCGARAPLLVWEGTGPPGARSADAAAAELATVAPGVAAGAWGASADATFQLLRAGVAEEPHVHDHHDLTVVLLRGRGAVIVAGRRYDLQAGDVLHVGRGRVHHFHPAGGEAALALAIYTPRLEGPDRRPAPARSPGGDD